MTHLELFNAIACRPFISPEYMALARKQVWSRTLRMRASYADKKAVMIDCLAKKNLGPLNYISE